MALSLNDKKLKRSIIGKPHPDLPKKTLTMPWKDRNPAETGAATEDLPIEASANAHAAEVSRSTANVTVAELTKSNVSTAETAAKPSPLLDGNESTSVGVEIGANSEPKRSQIRAKSAKDRSQFRAKTKPDQSQIGERSEPIQSQNRVATTTPRSEFGARIEAGSEPDQSQFRAKTEPGSEPKFGLADLSRLQDRCLDFVFESCRFSGSLISEKLFSGDLAVAVKSTPSAVKKALQRLEESRFICRSAFKKGPGGWTRYSLPEPVYRDLTVSKIRARSEPIQSQIGAKLEPGSEPRTEPSSPSSSSSELEIKKFNTTTTADSFVGDGWDEIDCTPVVSLGLRFGRPQIQQIAKAGGITPAELQDSILMFAFDLQHNRKRESIVGDPLGFFVGILRRGPYLPPQNYRSPEEMQKRAYLEWKRRDAEERQALDKEIIDFDFEAWWAELSDTSRREYEPKKVGADGFPAGSAFHLATLREIFAKTIWPSQQNKSRTFEIRQGATTEHNASDGVPASFESASDTKETL